MDERELERVAQRLGRGAAQRLDVERTAEGVLRRLKTAQAAGPRPVMRWLALAAGFVILIAGAAITIQGSRDPLPSSGNGVAVARGLYDLSADQLDEVLDSLQVSAPPSSLLTASLSDLDTEQLQELLTLMEG